MKKAKVGLLQIIALAVLMVVSIPVLVSAGQGFYVVDKSARTGMLVSLTNNPGVVEPSSDKNAPSLVGVIGSSGADLDVQTGQTAVQTDGIVQVIASTITGDIKVGDYISPSTIVGIGARNNSGGWVVGTAQGSLDSSTKDAAKTSLKDSSGASHDVYVAKINVLVKVIYYNPTSSQNIDSASRTPIPDKVQNFADSVAGKRASVLAVMLATLLLVIGFMVTGYIVNSTIHNGMQAIGRQPLARHSIIRAMLQTFLLAAGVLIGTVVGSLILIRLL